MRPVNTWTPSGEPRRWLETLLALANGPAVLGTACIEWPYATKDGGYGALWVIDTTGKRLRRVTHLVLEGTGRPRPTAPGDQALHSCDNPPCVHPDHLRWGTPQQNVWDMLAAR